MLYREIMTVCSEIHTKHINTLCGQKFSPLFVQRKPLSNSVSNHLTNTPNYAGSFSKLSQFSDP